MAQQRASLSSRNIPTKRVLRRSNVRTSSSLRHNIRRSTTAGTELEPCIRNCVSRFSYMNRISISISIMLCVGLWAIAAVTFGIDDRTCLADSAGMVLCKEYHRLKYVRKTFMDSFGETFGYMQNVFDAIDSISGKKPEGYIYLQYKRRR